MSNQNRLLPYFTVSLTITPQSNGQISCQRVVQQNGQPEKSKFFYGQSHNHAIANALEHLAEQYRQAASDGIINLCLSPENLTMRIATAPQ